MRENKEKNVMKKLNRKHIAIAAVTILVLLACAIAGYLLTRDEEPAEPSLDVILKEKLTAYETDLRDSLGSMETNEDVAEYLLNWAKNKKITAVKDAAGNVIYTVKAAEHAKDVQPAALLAGFDASNMDAYIEEMAVALTVAKNVQNNSPLKVIFLAEETGDKSGIQQLNINQLADNTAVFCLGTAPSGRVSAVTGGFEHIAISKKLTKAEPSYNKAYKVTLKNCPESLITGKYDASLNPIKTLGSVLANLKSTSLLFELASFSGGSDEMVSPSRASMTVVINDSDTAKFERKLNNSIEKIQEKNGEDYPELEYTYEEVDLPSKVIAKDDTDNLVSLMYTSFNGVYNRNEEGTITALTNIGRLSTKDSRLTINVAVMCSDDDMMQEISDAYETICGLCDVTYKVKTNYPVYNGKQLPQNEELLASFEEAFLSFTGDDTMAEENTAALTSCTFIHEKKENLPLLFCGVTPKTKHKMAGSIVTWLDQGVPQE